MTNNLPKSPNPKADEDIAEGRQMVTDTDTWLEELDRLLDGKD